MKPQMQTEQPCPTAPRVLPRLGPPGDTGHSHFCRSSALSVALFGFLFSWKCFTGGVRGPARVVRALLFKYRHSSGSMADASHSVTVRGGSSTGLGGGFPYIAKRKNPECSFLCTVMEQVPTRWTGVSAQPVQSSGASPGPWKQQPAWLSRPVCPPRS